MLTPSGHARHIFLTPSVSEMRQHKRGIKNMIIIELYSINKLKFVRFPSYYRLLSFTYNVFLLRKRPGKEPRD